jgi:hypothetical protein
MASEMGKSKLMGAMAARSPEGVAPMAGDMGGASKGFEMKPGSKGRSSGPCLPLSTGAPEGHSLLPSVESEAGEDEGAIEEPGEGFEDKPVA